MLTTTVIRKNKVAAEEAYGVGKATGDGDTGRKWWQLVTIWEKERESMSVGRMTDLLYSSFIIFFPNERRQVVSMNQEVDGRSAGLWFKGGDVIEKLEHCFQFNDKLWF